MRAIGKAAAIFFDPPIDHDRRRIVLANGFRLDCARRPRLFDAALVLLDGKLTYASDISPGARSEPCAREPVRRLRQHLRGCGYRIVTVVEVGA